MADAFLHRRIIHANWNRYQLHIMPCGKNKQFQFCFIPAGNERKSVQLMQRIDAHTCLRVRQVYRGLQVKPEIGELIGKLALAGHVLIRKLPASNYNGILMQI